MLSVRKSLIYFLIFVIVGAFVAYKITNTAYDGAYDYDTDYSYAIGDTDVYDPEGAR